MTTCQSQTDLDVRLASGAVLYDAGHPASGWRLESGALRLDCIGRDGPRFVQLVLPGDVIGLESLAGEVYAHTARAIVPSVVQPCAVSPSQCGEVLLHSMLKQQTRMAEVMNLRTGPAQERLKRLLLLLWPEDGSEGADGARALPTIKDVAGIIDTAPETVSRIFANLKRTHMLDARHRQAARYSTTRLRAMDWPAGMTRSDGGQRLMQAMAA